MATNSVPADEWEAGLVSSLREDELDPEDVDAVVLAWRSLPPTSRTASPNSPMLLRCSPRVPSCASEMPGWLQNACAIAHPELEEFGAVGAETLKIALLWWQRNRCHHFLTYHGFVKRRSKKLQRLGISPKAVIFKQYLAASESDSHSSNSRLKAVMLKHLSSDPAASLPGPSSEELVTLLVIGQTNSGKSQFINSLLQCNLLPVWVMHNRLGPREASSSMQISWEELVNIRETAPSGDFILCILSNCWQEEVDLSVTNVILEVFWPHPLLKAGVQLVDSPGMLESPELENIVFDYAQGQRLGVICLFDLATGGLPAHKHFITKLNLDPATIFFVGNKVDTVRPYNGPIDPVDKLFHFKQQVLEQMGERLYDSPDNFPRFSAYSSLEAYLLSQSSGDQVEPLKEPQAIFSFHAKLVDWIKTLFNRSLVAVTSQLLDTVCTLSSVNLITWNYAEIEPKLLKVMEEDIPKTAFSCALGHLEMVRMPFGLVNAGATYQRGMSQLFQGKQWQYILTYIISKEGIRPDPSKMEAIPQFPVPKGVEELRRFLGMTGYHRMFVKDYAIKANALMLPRQVLLQSDLYTVSMTTASASSSVIA
ncbi:hypothetical protein Pelo_5400 [Pelomyxa schiedti]|nr:hypothetical protein Pelo_5400 [Pelomyxa schiedti]